jgi:ABC-type antimicrobial peptide transport system permease subunit
MGLFGVVSGSVTRRRGELAVRLALGATHDNVLRLVLREGAAVIVLGSLIGIPGVYIPGQALRGILIGVLPFDALAKVRRHYPVAHDCGRSYRRPATALASLRSQGKRKIALAVSKGTLRLPAVMVFG